jgi:hypothetical protein
MTIIKHISRIRILKRDSRHLQLFRTRALALTSPSLRESMTVLFNV